MTIKEYISKKVLGENPPPFDISFVDKDGFLQQGKALDVVAETFNDYHTLSIIFQDEEGAYYLITKKCLAPPGCLVDWDEVHCAFNL